MSRPEKITFTGSTGHALAGIGDVPEGPVRGWGVYSHGLTLGKDSPAASRICKGLAEQGVGMLRFDNLGLGGSAGEWSAGSFSVKVADTIFGRFCGLFGPDGIPDPARLLLLDHETIRSAGFSRSKVVFLRDLATHVVDGRLELDALHEREDAHIVAIATDDPAQLPLPTTLPILDLNDAAVVVAFLLAEPGRYLYRPPGRDGAGPGPAPAGVARVPARALRRSGGREVEEQVAD